MNEAKKTRKPAEETAQENKAPPFVGGRSVGVTKFGQGEWVARIYEVSDTGEMRIIKESQPDLRAVALERMHVYLAQTFLLEG